MRRLFEPAGVQRREWFRPRTALAAVVLLMASLGATDAALADTSAPVGHRDERHDCDLSR